MMENNLKILSLRTESKNKEIIEGLILDIIKSDYGLFICKKECRKKVMFVHIVSNTFSDNVIEALKKLGDIHITDVHENHLDGLMRYLTVGTRFN